MEGCGETGAFVQYWWKCKNGTATLESSLKVSYKTEHKITNDLPISLLGIYSREIKKSCEYKNLYKNLNRTFAFSHPKLK